ncbi:hypothetical protein [Tepidimicrobium xylanilyticum]
MEKKVTVFTELKFIVGENGKPVANQHYYRITKEEITEEEYLKLREELKQKER